MAKKGEKKKKSILWHLTMMWQQNGESGIYVHGYNAIIQNSSFIEREQKESFHHTHACDVLPHQNW